ncbi:MAG TPA: hypothetical protein VFT59_03520 [Candidatus Saccharimonadales bacterium]|nr:hypothetical protein [Candidatus Saccharimonadales bacterium]
MQQETTHSRLKQILVIIACLLGAVAVGWGAIFILKTLEPTKNNSSMPQSVLSSTEVITQYATKDVIPELSTATYDKQIDHEAHTTIIYKAMTAGYVVDAPAKDSVLFSSKEASRANNIALVQDQTSNFMQKHGLAKVENTGSAALSSNPAYRTYENDKTVCQLSSNHAKIDVTSLVFHTLSCADKTAIQEEYTAIDKLLSFYKTNHQQPSFTEANRQVTIEGNKAMAILTLTNNNTVNSLLFAAIDGSWNYIGSLSDTSAPSNGKHSLSVEVQQAIRDPKWGDFLSKNLQAS